MTAIDLRHEKALRADAQSLALRSKDRKVLVELLRSLADHDRHQHYRVLAYSSLWDYVTRRLGFSSQSAQLRITAMRMAVKIPLVAQYLEDGRLNLSQVCALKDVLTTENAARLLDHAMGKSEKDLAAQVAGTLAAVTGKPAPRRPGTVTPVQAAPPALMLELTPGQAATSGAEVDGERITPVVTELHLIKVLVSTACADDLEALRNALSHRFPDRDLEAVLHHAIKLALEAEQRRTEGVGIERQADPARRHIPRRVRKQVMARDGRQCTYVSPDGRRCESRYQLEPHHRIPWAKGGPTTVENLEIRCSMHNQLQARIELGDDHIDRCIATSRGEVGPHRDSG